MTRPAEYWKKRAEANMDRVQEGAEQRLARLGRAYRQAAQELTDEVKRILGTYAKRFDLTPEEAAAALQEPFDEESRAYGYRVSRAEALKAAIQERMNRLGVQVERETAAQREWTASKSYQSARKMVQDMTGGLVNHATPDLRGMLQAMDTVWAGGNYSARIWKNTERLAETLSSEIEAAFLSGKSVRRMADTIMERFGVGYRAAECLVRTETSYVQNRTAARSYEDAGCTEYEVLTAQDRRTCQYCAKQNGRRYLLATMQAGENAPPFHPNCRCTVLPVVEEGAETGKAEAAKQEEIGFAVAKTGTAIEERIKLESSSPIRKEIQLEGTTFPLEVNPEKQKRHMAGDKSYIPGRSVITLPMEKIQELVYEKAGSGTIARMNAEQIQEILDFEIEVGYTVNRKGEAAKTSFVKIHYSKTGVHVVPYSGKKEK